MNNREILIYILQILAIYNAIILGWDVKKLDNNKYEFSKKMPIDKNYSLTNFVDNIVSFNIDSYKNLNKGVKSA